MVEHSGQGKPVMGMASAPARANSRFKPDVSLSDGERITLTKGPDGEVTHTLQAIFTPGHAANHLCFLLEEDALLFSGDHILNGSTTVISPPDGNMIDYLASLDKLHALCLERSIRYILPPGYVLGFARHQILLEPTDWPGIQGAQRHAHQPDGSIQEWVAIAYADTPKALCGPWLSSPAGPCGADSEALSGQISQQPPPRPAWTAGHVHWH